jgi:hypothetical protein
VAGPPAADTAGDPSVNHRPERTVKQANARVPSVEGLDGRLKLSAGERRILTRRRWKDRGPKLAWNLAEEGRLA